MLTQQKIKKAVKSALSVYRAYGSDDKDQQQVLGAHKRFQEMRPERCGEVGAHIEETEQTGSQPLMGSRSIDVCHDVKKGHGDQGNSADANKEIQFDRDRDLDRWLPDVDTSSIDGSRFSDSSVEDLGSDPQSHKVGAGATDTDTDDELGWGDKQDCEQTDAAENRKQQQKIGQISPLVIYYTEISREFHWHRFFFHHYENVDFSVFELGSRRLFLVWRGACLATTILLLFYTYKEGGWAGLSPYGTRAGTIVCLHVWLIWLLLLQLLVEVPTLAVQYSAYPTCYLARVHTTPLQYKFVWFLNNIISANIFSLVCTHAMLFCDSDISKSDTAVKTHLILSFLCLANTTLGATPIRLAHGLYPVLLTLTYIVYANTALRCTSSPRYIPHLEKNGPIWRHWLVHERLRLEQCYLEPLMWHVNSMCCVTFTALWMALTFGCHCGLVLLCWARRVVFRCHRQRSAPVYGQSPTTHFYTEHGAEVSPQMVRLIEEDGFKAQDFVTGYQNSPPFTSAVPRRRWRTRGTRDDGLDFL